VARSHGGVEVETELVAEWAISIVARVQGADGRGRQGGAQEEEAQLGQPARQVMRSSAALAGDRIVRVDDGMFTSSHLHHDDVHVGKAQLFRSGFPSARFTSSFLGFCFAWGSVRESSVLDLVSILGLTFFSRLAFLEQRRTIKKRKREGKGKAVQVLSI
jgi:hypothetical protein